MPEGTWMLPLTVSPENRRMITIHEVFHLRNHVVRYVAVEVVKIEWIIPLVKRVIEPHFQPVRHNRPAQLSGKVLMRTHVDAVPVPVGGAGPQAESIVVLRCQYDVLRAGINKQFGPLIGIKQLCFEAAREILVMEILSVVAQVERPRRAVPVVHVVPVPLSVGLAGLRMGISECRNGINSPVDKDAELRLIKPLRDRPLVERGPVGLIMNVLCPRTYRHRTAEHEN